MALECHLCYVAKGPRSPRRSCPDNRLPCPGNGERGKAKKRTITRLFAEIVLGAQETGKQRQNVWFMMETEGALPWPEAQSSLSTLPRLLRCKCKEKRRWKERRKEKARGMSCHAGQP